MVEGFRISKSRARKGLYREMRDDKGLSPKSRRAMRAMKELGCGAAGTWVCSMIHVGLRFRVQG